MMRIMTPIMPIETAMGVKWLSAFNKELNVFSPEASIKVSSPS